MSWVAKKKPPNLYSTAWYCTTLEALGFDGKRCHCLVSPVSCSQGLQSWDLVGQPGTGEENSKRLWEHVTKPILPTPGWAQAKLARGIGSWRSWGENPGHGHSVISTGMKLAGLLEDQIMVYNTAILQGMYVKGIFTTTSRTRNQDTEVTCTCPCRTVNTRNQELC